jgi:ubiquinone/menaquinone biosynthesis C-methylase UbiE
MRSILTDEEWATRHLREGEDWIKGYWESRDHPNRAFLIGKICKHFPIHSVLEIGCASGPNLYLLAKKFPEAEIRGIDINPMAVKKGNEWFMQEDISNVKLEVGRAQELERFADKSFDLVLTDAVLIYVAPEEIKKVAENMLRISRIIVMREWHIFHEWLALVINGYYCLRLKTEAFRLKSPSLGFFVGHWARNYRALFKELAPKRMVQITKLPEGLWDDKGWQRWGAIIEVAK